MTPLRAAPNAEAVSRALGRIAPAGRVPTREDWHEPARRWDPWLDERIAALERLRDKLSSCIGCGCLSLDKCSLDNPDDTDGRLGTGPRYLPGDSSGDPRLRG